MLGEVSLRSHLIRGGGWLLVAMIVCGAYDAAYLKIFATDRVALRAQFTAYPDLAFPSLPAFLREVRERTEPGSSIALVVPMRDWPGEYEHAFLRASYILAGRRVIALVAPGNRLQTERIAEADYVAVWHARFTAPGFGRVWESSEGTLEKRVR